MQKSCIIKPLERQPLPQFMMTSRWLFILGVLGMLLGSIHVHAETPAPSIYWGGLAYPDQKSSLLTGITLLRFTEFDGDDRRYPSTIEETIGLNLLSASWTERLGSWGFNLTGGAGPTHNQPTEFLQNDFVHNYVFDYASVPVGDTREAADFMLGGSVTRWFSLLGSRENTFMGIGVTSGTLYHEPYIRAGFRRIPFPSSAFLRMSALGRYGQLYNSSAFPSIAPQSYLGQVSLSLGDYRDTPVPRWELEFGMTIHSGLFVTRKGNSLEEILGTLAFRFPYGRVEMWNDMVNSKDRGPSFGGTLMLDILPFIRST
ncbi:MAG: hypothetical protein NPIRA04_12040 [Nitrospirales bacterium]|nr:MAG: hypothetical protein NPIRA04_12040 [Nitrospirales bacterium]